MKQLDSEQKRVMDKTYNAEYHKHPLDADWRTPALYAAGAALLEWQGNRKHPFDPPCAHCARSDGWHKAQGHPPLPVGDCRKIVWIATPDGMAYWGVRAYSSASDGEGMAWTVNGREESDTVEFWMEGPHNPNYPAPAPAEGAKGEDTAFDLLKRMTEKLHIVLPLTDSFITLQAVRSGDSNIYDGPSLEQELKEADALIAARARDSKSAPARADEAKR